MTHIPTIIARWVGFSVLILLAIILQIIVFPRIGFLPNPNIALSAAISLAVLCKTPVGAASGFIIGIIVDALLPHTEAYFAITFLAAATLTSYICGKYLQRKFMSALVMASGSAFVIQIFYILIFQAATGRAPLGSIIYVGLLEILTTIIFVPLIYPLFRLFARGMEEER